MLTATLNGRDLLRIGDLAPAEAEGILDLAVELREQPKQPLLPGATLGLYFAKHSTRTRVSFSAAMTQLGGAASRCRIRRVRSRATSTRSRCARMRIPSSRPGRSGPPFRSSTP